MYDVFTSKLISYLFRGTDYFQFCMPSAVRDKKYHLSVKLLESLKLSPYVGDLGEPPVNPTINEHRT